MSATSLEPERRLQDTLAPRSRPPSKRMLIIVNPYATTVSDRLKHLVVYALRGSYLVDAIDTERRDHATDLCREAAGAGYDVVVAFGGDGTVNEAANGLAGSGVPLTCLPGGRANVFCRILGIPSDVVDATERLLGLVDSWRPRTVDLGRCNGRHFLFAAGAGLDAHVVQRVDSHPGRKARAGEYYYAWVATGTFARRYLVHPPRLEARIDERAVKGATVIVQNTVPYTYFGDRPVHLAEGVTLDSGDLGGVVLRRTSPLDISTVPWRALASRPRVAGHRQIYAFSGVRELQVRSLDERSIPLQVDGDYIGEAAEARFGVAPRALTVVA